MRENEGLRATLGSKLRGAALHWPYLARGTHIGFLEHGMGHDTVWGDVRAGQCWALLASLWLLGPPPFMSSVVNWV